MNRSTAYLCAAVLLAACGCQAANRTEATLGKGRTFFGIPIGNAHKVVFLVDRHCTHLDYMKHELKRTILELDENTEFLVLFYSTGPLVETPPGRPVPATEGNKKSACEFIDGVDFWNTEFDPKAIERAFAEKPTAILLEACDEVDKKTADLVRQLNAERKVRVHTICLFYKEGEEILKQIADENGGEYRFVSERDIEKLVQ